MWQLPVPAADKDVKVGAELGERGGRGAADAAGAAEHEHAGARARLAGGSGRGGGGGRGGRRGAEWHACSDHGGHAAALDWCYARRSEPPMPTGGTRG